MTAATAFLEAHSKFSKTPGMQYAFFSADDILCHFEKGFADILARTGMQAQQTINAYSVTKTLTALGILRMAMEGRLKLSDSFKKYIPNLPYPDEISILHLLTHTAGIPNPLPLNWIHLVSENHAFDRNAFFEEIFLKHPKTKSRPNEKFAYSNLGYVILGWLIESISGLVYEQFITENILSRIGVLPSELGFVHPNSSLQITGYQKNFSFMNLLLGFFIDKAKFTGKPTEGWLPFSFFYVNGTAYGGLIASLNGLIKYVQAFLQPRNPFLSDEWTRLLFLENKTCHGEKTGMCCSWFVGSLNGITYYCHAGGGGGYYCEIRLYPEISRGSVVIFNRSGMSDERFLDKADSYFVTG